MRRGAIVATICMVFGAAAGDAETFTLSRRFVAPVSSPQAHFGYAAAASGPNVFVGAPADETESGAAGTAFVFGPQDGGTSIGLGGQAGASVAATDAFVVVGSPTAVTNGVAGGAALLFAPDGTFLRALEPTSAPSAGDRFGFAVSAAGTTIVVGAPGVDVGGEDAGAAYVFDGDPNSPTFGQQRPGVPILRRPVPEAFDQFGASVLATATSILVGAPLADDGQMNAGAVHEFAAATGQALRVLHKPTPAEADLFGLSLAAMGSTVFVGAPFDDVVAVDGGAVYAFAAGETQGVQLSSPDVSAGDAFGASLATAGSRLAVGAPSTHRQGADGAGVVYVLDGDLGGPSFGAVIAVLASPSPTTGARFGFSLAAAGDGFLVGVPREGAGEEGALYRYVPGGCDPSPVQCTDGNETCGDGCDPNCRVSGCGNGFLCDASGEGCDVPGVPAGASGNICRPDCTVCGDGIVQGGEECDGGTRCTSDCRSVPCNGNGVELHMDRTPASVLLGGTVTYRISMLNLDDPSIPLVACDADDVDVVFYCPDVSGAPDFNNPQVLTTSLPLPAGTPEFLIGGDLTCTLNVNPGVFDAVAEVRAGDQFGALDDVTQGRLLDSSQGQPFRLQKQLGTEVVTTTTSTSSSFGASTTFLVGSTTTMIGGSTVLDGTRSSAGMSPGNCNGNGVAPGMQSSSPSVVVGGTVSYTVGISNLDMPGSNLVACDAEDIDVVLYCPGADGEPDFSIPRVITTSLMLPAGTQEPQIGEPVDCTVNVFPGVSDAVAEVRAGDQEGPLDDLTQGVLLDAAQGHPFSVKKRLGAHVITTSTSTSTSTTFGTSTTSVSSTTTTTTLGGCRDDTDCPDDGNACNGPEHCKPGCPPGACGIVKICCGARSECVSGPLPSAPLPCDDMDPCTEPDFCAGGVCVGPPTSCDDGIDCTTPLGCNQLVGCYYDVSTCTCSASSECNDREPCTTDFCGSDHVCHAAQVEDGTACDDSDPCNGQETCRAGRCSPGTPLSCGDPCVSKCVKDFGCMDLPPDRYLLVACRLDASLAAAGCELPSRASAKVAKAKGKLNRAGTKACKAKRRTLRGGYKFLGQGIRVVGKANAVDPTCREKLSTALTEARTSVGGLLAEPCR